MSKPDKPAIHVTAHALLRYLERVKGVDVEGARAHIAAVCGPAAALGAKNRQLGGER